MAHKNDRKVCHNTTAVINDDDSVSIWFHQTEIIRAYRNGKTIIRNGGYATVTTKARLNSFLPRGTYISQTAFVWQVFTVRTLNGNAMHRRLTDFTDGMTISFSEYGQLSNWTDSLSKYEWSRIHSIATGFVFGTSDAPTIDNVERFVSGSDDEHIGRYLLVYVARMASDMIATGIRPSVA
jgi:hypothetical protein